MPDVEPYYVVVDSNIWVAERLLQSSIGTAFLYSLTAARSSILLPEVVEMEIARVLPDMAERAVSLIRREVTLLKQLSGHTIMITAPTALAIEEGITDRWKQLTGSLIRVPYTHEQAMSALRRVIRKSPPSGENNEQFRDCCIWDSAVSMAKDRVVHLVSADAAFYENRKKDAGLANLLREELKAAEREVRIYPSLRDFLNATTAGATEIDEIAIADAIAIAIKDRAYEIATDGKAPQSSEHFEIVKAYPPKISGYATPKPSLIAISFEARFDLERTSIQAEAEARDEITMRLNGVGSYDPTTNDLSEIEIREWDKSVKSSSGIHRGTGSHDPAMLERQYGPGRMRFIT